MTIALGFRCSNGLVLCTDSLLSAEDHHKYYEEKIYPLEGNGWAVIFAYAGLPSLMKELHDKTGKQLEQTESVTTNYIYQTLDRIFTEMGRQYITVPVQVLTAVSISGETLEMLAFDGKGLHSADRFNCFGVGDTSLVRYLADALYNPGISTEYGLALGIYLVSKAKKYIEGVEGQTQVAIIRAGGTWEPFDGDPQIWERDSVMDAAEALFLPKIIEKGVKGI